MPPPGVTHGRWATGGWTADQFALLGTAPDGVVAARLGRTAAAVKQKRYRLGVPAFRGERPKTPGVDSTALP